ncbi:MAG: hypothetical protein OXU20_23615 [Myxococcales bacterium]|nr:hypothetical protein [Myxococcales bacterium]
MSEADRGRPRPRPAQPVARAAAEPSPALKGALDVGLKYPVAEELASDLDGLAERVAELGGDGPWLSVYDRAIGLIEQLIDSMQERIEAAQARMADAGDTSELKQRLSTGPRKAAERARAQAKAAVNKAGKEWSERCKRQLEHVLEQCGASGVSALKVTTEEVAGGLQFGVDSAWWAEFAGYVERCMEEWTRTTTSGADQALSQAALQGAADVSSLTEGRALGAPEPQEPPAVQANLRPPVEPSKVPMAGAASALMKHMRSNVMMIGVFGTALGVIFFIVGRLAGNGEADTPNTMLIRGGLILAALPISAIIGLKAIRSERQKLREDGAIKHREAMAGHLTTVLKKALERHRGVLERWVLARQAAWEEQVEQFWSESVEPALQRLDEQASDQLKQAKLEQSRAGDELSSAKMVKNQLSQNLLFELKKRRREVAARETKVG